VNISYCGVDLCSSALGHVGMMVGVGYFTFVTFTDRL